MQTRMYVIFHGDYHYYDGFFSGYIQNVYNRNRLPRNDRDTAAGRTRPPLRRNTIYSRKYPVILSKYRR